MTNNFFVPANFLCPITCDIMRNPVLLVEDGHSYEKSALELWLEKHNTSPITNKELKTRTFVVNYNLKSTIEEFCQLQNESKSKLAFYSFSLRRGRLQNKDWKKLPKLQIILSLLGSSTVGKSCLATNVEYGPLQEDFKPRVTLAVDVFFFYLDRLFEDKYVVVIQLNDCPGTDRFEAVSDRHFRNCHGAILVVDSTNIETLDRLQSYWYKRLLEKSTFDHVEAVLACNKIDLLEKNYDSTYREQFFRQAETFASHHQIPIFNISALRGDNVQAMFHHLISSILKNPSLVTNLKENQRKINEQASTQCTTIQLTKSLDVRERQRKSTCKC